MIPSPCINICVVDAARVCTGCGRTLAEIERWPSASDDERRAIVIAARDRRLRPGA